MAKGELVAIHGLPDPWVAEKRERAVINRFAVDFILVGVGFAVRAVSEVERVSGKRSVAQARGGIGEAGGVDLGPGGDCGGEAVELGVHAAAGVGGGRAGLDDPAACAGVAVEHIAVLLGLAPLARLERTEAEERGAAVAEIPAVALDAFQDGAFAAERGVEPVVRVVFRHVENADERAFALQILAEGAFAVSEGVAFAIGEAVRALGVFLEHGERAARGGREPFEEGAARLLVEACVGAGDVFPLAGEGEDGSVPDRETRLFVAAKEDAAAMGERGGAVAGDFGEERGRVVIAGDEPEGAAIVHAGAVHGAVAAEIKPADRGGGVHRVGAGVGGAPVFGAAGRGGVVALVPGAGDVEQHPVKREAGAFLHLRIDGEVGEHLHRGQVHAVVSRRGVFVGVAMDDLVEVAEEAVAGGGLDLSGVEAVGIDECGPLLGGEVAGAVVHEAVVERAVAGPFFVFPEGDVIPERGDGLGRERDLVPGEQPGVKERVFVEGVEGAFARARGGKSRGGGCGELLQRLRGVHAGEQAGNAARHAVFGVKRLRVLGGGAVFKKGGGAFAVSRTVEQAFGGRCVFWRGGCRRFGGIGGIFGGGGRRLRGAEDGRRKNGQRPRRPPTRGRRFKKRVGRGGEARRHGSGFTFSKR